MVAFKDITYDAVIEAINEYDRLGQDVFLREYGFHPAREYVLVHDGKSYDSKAIVGAGKRVPPAVWQGRHLLARQGEPTTHWPFSRTGPLPRCAEGRPAWQRR